MKVSSVGSSKSTL